MLRNPGESQGKALPVTSRRRLRFHSLSDLPARLSDPYCLDLNHPFPQVCQTLWKNCRLLPEGTVPPGLHLVPVDVTGQPYHEIGSGLQRQRFRQLSSRRLFPGCARYYCRKFTCGGGEGLVAR